MSILLLQFQVFFSECSYIHYIIAWIFDNNSFRTNWVKFCGSEYRPDAGVVISVEQDLPVVGCIKAIYVINGKEVAFNVTLHLTFYEKHFRAYVLENNILQETIVHYSMLFLQAPVHIRTSQVLSQVHFIFLPHALCTI